MLCLQIGKVTIGTTHTASIATSISEETHQKGNCVSMTDWSAVQWFGNDLAMLTDFLQTYWAPLFEFCTSNYWLWFLKFWDPTNISAKPCYPWEPNQREELRCWTRYGEKCVNTQILPRELSNFRVYRIISYKPVGIFSDRSLCNAIPRSEHPINAAVAPDVCQRCIIYI